ncbi:MAG: DUF2953 domain-containing protein [Oscillospiraceae bacterium]
MIALYILLGIVILIIAILSIKIRIDAEYIDDFQMVVKWLFLKFKIYPLPPKKEKPQKEEIPKEEKQEAPVEEKLKKPNIFMTFYQNQGYEGVIKLLKDSVDALGSLMKSIKKHFIIDELFLWITVSRNHDAAATAIDYGNVCQDVFPALGFICSNFKVKKYDAEVEPDFIGTFSSAQFATAFSIRPIFLIGAGLALVFRLLFKVVFKLLFPKKQKSNENIDLQNT